MHATSCRCGGSTRLRTVHVAAARAVRPRAARIGLWIGGRVEVDHEVEIADLNAEPERRTSLAFVYRPNSTIEPGVSLRSAVQVFAGSCCR
jgi:hypothetical protein